MPQAPRHAPGHVAGRDASHVPQRTCVGCRRTRPRPELLRLAATRDTVRFDARQRLPGRGAYVCPDSDCVDAAAARDARAVHRSLRRGDTHHQVMTALHHVRRHLAGEVTADATHHEEHTA